MTRQGVTGTRFTVWAPNAQGVRVCGDFCRWDGTAYPHAVARFLGRLGAVHARHRRGNAVQVRHHPARRHAHDARRPDGPPHRSASGDRLDRHGVIHVLEGAEWMAGRGARRVHEAPLSVYEVHLPSWRPGLTYRQLAEQLPAYVSDLGFTQCCELMPVAEHPFGGSWGYQVHRLLRPHRTARHPRRLQTPRRRPAPGRDRRPHGLGTGPLPARRMGPRRIRRTPPLRTRGPQRAAHPDWGTLEFNYGRREVRNFLITNAVYWCARSSTSMACASTPSPRCSTSTTRANRDSGPPTNTAAGRTSTPSPSSRR